MCTKKGCKFSVTSSEGHFIFLFGNNLSRAHSLSGSLEEGTSKHNHPAQPGLFEISQAKAKLRQGLDQYLATTRNETTGDTNVPKVSDALYRAMTHCEYDGIMQKDDSSTTTNPTRNVKLVREDVSENQVTIVKQEMPEPCDIKLEPEEDPLSLSPAVECINKKQEFVYVPSTSGSAKFVPNGKVVKPVKKEALEPDEIKLESEEEPFQEYVSVPSMFGGTKLVPKAKITQGRRPIHVRVETQGSDEIKLEPEEELSPLHSPSTNKEQEFVSVPSMFGGTKLVPKVTVAQDKRLNSDQIRILEKAFQQTQYPDSRLKQALAREVDQPVIRVQTWFQMRRDKEMNEMNKRKKTSQCTTTYYNVSKRMKILNDSSGQSNSPRSRSPHQRQDTLSMKTEFEDEEGGDCFNSLIFHYQHPDDANYSFALRVDGDVVECPGCGNFYKQLMKHIKTDNPTNTCKDKVEVKSFELALNIFKVRSREGNFHRQVIIFKMQNFENT